MKLLKQWESTTNKLIEVFLIKYFELEDEDMPLDYYWIGGDVGGVLEFADYYFNLGDIKLCLEKDIPKEKFFAWYHWCLEEHDEHINLQSFVWGAAEIKQKEIEDLEERIKFIEERLDEQLKRYKELQSLL